MTAIVATVGATGASTNLSCCASTINANTAVVREVFELEGWFRFIHTAAATPTLTLELLINGAVICSCVTIPPSTANTYHGTVRGVFTVRAIGAGGSVMAAVALDGYGATQAHQFGGATVDIATDAVDFSQNRSAELRVRMTTAVTANSLDVTQGHMRRRAH